MYRTPKSYEETREHFVQRLKERYDMDLTNDEYNKLVSRDFLYQNIYKVNGLTLVIWAKIKNKHVLCIYKKKENRDFLGGEYKGVKMPSRLVTCLKINDKMPVPFSLIREGFDKEKFEKEVNNVITQVVELSKEIGEVGKAEFFKNNKSHFLLKGMAVSWYLRGEISISAAINYIKYKIYENKIINILNP